MKKFFDPEYTYNKSEQFKHLKNEINLQYV